MKMKKPHGKKLISFALVFALLISIFSILPFSAFAAAEVGTEFTSDLLTYTVTSGNTVELTSVAKNLTDIAIPENVNYEGADYKVTTLKAAENVFDSNALDNSKNTLASLNIPGTIKKVPNSLCGYFKSLKTITLNEGTEEIDQSAFCGTAIEKVDLPTTLTSLGNDVFFNCPELKEASINSDIELEENTFGACFNLSVIYFNSKNIELNNNTRYFYFSEISNFVMYVYSGTKAEKYSKDHSFCTRYIELIGKGPQNSETFTVGDLTYRVGNRTPKDEIVPANIYSCAVSLTEVDVPSTFTYEDIKFSVKKFLLNAFENSGKTLRKVTVPESINDNFSLIWAFSECTALKEIYFYSDTVDIYENAFPGVDMTQLTFYGNIGSTAEKFAKENNIKFLTLDGSELPTDATVPTQSTQPTDATEQTTAESSTVPQETTVPSTTHNSSTAPFTTTPTDDLIIGDTDGNGIVDIKDATYIQKHLVKYKKSNGQPLIDENDNRQFKIADVNGDKSIDVNDVTELQKRIARLR